MAPPKSTLSRPSHKSAPVAATNMSLDSWCHQLPTQPTQFIRKIEICTALAASRDPPGDKTHFHTLLRVILVPTSSDPSAPDGVLLVERVLSILGAHHAVTPMSEALSIGGTLFYPEIHDRVCVVADGPRASAALARQLEVERTLAFGTDPSEPHLTLAQFAQILEFISRTTASVCTGGDCEYHSRLFAFTCLDALTPSLPPSTSSAREGAGRSVRHGSDLPHDWVFELGAESSLKQALCMANDPRSMQALGLMLALKNTPRERALAGLYH